MLRTMRRSTVWLLIAVLWMGIATLTAVRQGWQRAWLQSLISLLFFGVAFYFRRKEAVR
jgi:phosphoglycerol transferase MdoB-like AlkP superfamily enzyme